MARPTRLTAIDATFLALSTPETPFSPGCLFVLDRPVSRDTLAARIEPLLVELPRYRQRIARAPIVRGLAWVDDDQFSLDRHVDVLHVPPPGGMRELEASVEMLLAAELPGDRPPWRVWTVEGLAGGRGAIVAIVHHALVEGVGGIGVCDRLLQRTPEVWPEAWDAPPGASERAGVDREVTAIEAARPRSFADRLLQRVAADLRSRAEAWRRLRTELEPRRHVPVLADFLWQGVHRASDLRLDGRGATRERSFATFEVMLDDAIAIERALAVTVDDVVLACISGALRRDAARRGIDPDDLHEVRAMVPVNRHGPGDLVTAEERIALLLVGLAVDEQNPMVRVRRIAQTTKTLERRDMAGAVDLLVTLSDLTWSGVLANVVRFALRRRAFNLVIANVPGPQTSRYLADARVERIVPIVNLWPHIPFGIAVGGYAGALSISVDADRAVMPDPAVFVGDLARSFEDLRAAAAPRAPHAPPPASM